METGTLTELIEREKAFLSEQEVGTDEYVASLNRLTKLEQQLVEIQKHKDTVSEGKKNRILGAIGAVAKVAIVDIGIPVVGLIAITAAEKEITFTGALRDYTKLFLPKKKG